MEGDNQMSEQNIPLSDKRFVVIQKYCRYSDMVREDGDWKLGCKCPTNVPQGQSWSDCNKESCPCYNSLKKLFPRKKKLKKITTLCWKCHDDFETVIIEGVTKQVTCPCCGRATIIKNKVN